MTPHTGQSARLPTRAGFTLIEVLAAVILTAIVVAAAVGFQLQLSRQATAATARTREGRHAVTILDRVARDLEGAFLLSKPSDVDPLDHPWLFVAQNATGQAGADRVKFVTRNYRPRGSAGHAADLAVVSYALRLGADEASYELLRTASPGLSEGFDHEIETREDEGALVMAKGLGSFALRFLSDDGEWKEDWDSTTLIDSSELPLMAEIELTLLDELETLDDLGSRPDGGIPYMKRVVIPIRPIDLQAMLEGEGIEGDETKTESCEETLAECVRRAGAGAGLPQETIDGIANSEIANTPACDVREQAQSLGIQCF